MSEYELEYGPTLIAVAATSKPHLRQRGTDISIISRNNKDMVRIPVARKGVYRHRLAPDGKLVLDDKAFTKMINNFNNKVTDFNVHLDVRHKDEEGALALLDKDDGGELTVEDGWLVAYGFPTDERAKELIQTKRYRYASAEIHPDYQSNLIHQLSTDDLTIYELQEEDKRGNNMSDVTISQEEYDRLKAASEELERLKTAPPETQTTQAEVIPESIRLKLESLERRAKEADRTILMSNVALAITQAEAYRDERGYGHSPVFLNTIKSLLLAEPVGEGDQTIKLEGSDEASPERVANYYRMGLIRLAKITPGQVNMTGKTEGTEVRLEVGNGVVKFTPEEISQIGKNMWANHIEEVN